MPEFAAEVSRIVAAASTVLALILPVMGLTGGLKGLFDRAPDLSIGPWTIKDGHYMSFLSAAALLVLAHALGFAPDLSGVDSLGRFLVAEWTALVVAANIVYTSAGYEGGLNWEIGFIGEDEPEPALPVIEEATKTRRSAK